MYSLSNLGRVDIEYISSITGEDYKTIIGALKGLSIRTRKLGASASIKAGKPLRNICPAT